MKKAFKGESLEECIDAACTEFEISKDKLNYKIIDQRKRFFKKLITIEVNLEDEKLDKLKNTKENDGFVEVKDGVIKVTNPKIDGKPAYISSSKDLTIIVNGEKIQGKKEVFEESKIDVIFPENEAKRILNINTTPNKLEAYISIKYEPKKIFTLKDKNKDNFVAIEPKVSQTKYSPFYSEEDIKNELIKKEIKYGIIDENIKLFASNKDVNNLIIAKGIKTVNDEDDILNILFKKNNKNNIGDDDRQTIDYRNKTKIVTVKKGDIIGEKIIGKEGNDGINIYGKKIKRKKGRKIKLKILKGCRIENNKIIAITDGRPEYRNSAFNVNPLYESNKDVDLETGNIDFIGDVVLYGNVTEGMKVKAGNSILINGNTSDAQIVSKYDIKLKKSVILSHVRAGGEDVQILEQIDYLKQINCYVQKIKLSVEQIEKQGRFNDKIKLGQVVKLLLENKCRDMPKLFIKLSTVMQSLPEEDEILRLIKSNFIGFGPINIKKMSQINEVSEKIQERIDKLSEDISIPANVEIGYCQNSQIESSGNITITGKGEYVSKIIANDSIIFQDERSIARGGMLKAKNKIECNIVGSEGGVITQLMVKKKGHIYIKRAFPNTSINIGEVKSIINVQRRDVHAYIDKNGELQIESLKS